MREWVPVYAVAALVGVGEQVLQVTHRLDARGAAVEDVVADAEHFAASSATMQ